MKSGVDDSLDSHLTAIVQSLVDAGRVEIALDELAELAEQHKLGFPEVELLVQRLDEASIGVEQEMPQVHLRQMLMKVLKTARDLRAETDKPPSPSDIAKRIGLQPAFVRRILQMGAGFAGEDS